MYGNIYQINRMIIKKLYKASTVLGKKFPHNKTHYKIKSFGFDAKKKKRKIRKEKKNHDQV